MREPYPRLTRFAAYLQRLVGTDGLLPVEDLGIPSVWIDHVAYQRQRHKQCAFNLYAAAAMRWALAPLCKVFGDKAQAGAIEQFGRQLESAAVRSFWNDERGLFINNEPWLAEEKATHTCDRSLATALLFDQCPGGRIDAALKALVDCPPEMGFSYPANAGWRLWALAKAGRADVIVADLRRRWAVMDSVRDNDTLQEDWTVRRDSGQQWSHCPVVPLYIAYHGLMGLKPLSPGFTRYELRPQLADLKRLELTAHTVRGPITLQAQGVLGDREVTIDLPPQAQGEIVLPQGEAVELARAAAGRPRRPRSLPLAAWRQNHLTTATGLIHKLAFEPDGTQGRASPADNLLPLGLRMVYAPAA